MKRAWRSRLWRSTIVCVGGSLGLVLLAYGCYLLHVDVASAGFTLLVLISLLSLTGRYFDSILLSVVAILCLDYFVIPPLFSLDIGDPGDAVALTAFLTTSLIITGLTARMRKMAAEELRQTRTALARFARVATIGELTASIAHEVNQPLAGVVSSANACLRWLASDPPNVEKAQQSANRIIRDANRASQVVQRVRNLIKNTPPQKAWVDINAAVQEVSLLTRYEIEQNRIALTTRLPDDLPPVWADRIQLQQVFLNLIGNAVDALKTVGSGPRELLISTERDAAGFVLSAVRDSGPGLDEARLHDIFDPFYTTRSDGMGMGLAISRSIIEAHGGHLWAEPDHKSGADQRGGALFQFTLPTTQQDAA
jgi:signal transduction histidine kinase